MKTAEELNITQQEYDAFGWVADMLRAGALKHDEFGDEYVPDNMFDLGTSCTAYSCGTTGCIGGWASLYMQNVEQDSDGRYMPTPMQEHAAHMYMFEAARPGQGHAGKRELFYGAEYYITNMSNVTPRQAADAIDNYRNTGDPDWASVLAD